MDYQNIFNALALAAFALSVITFYLYFQNTINMATQEQFDNLRNDMNTDLQNVRNDIAGLKTKIEDLEQTIKDITDEAGLTAEQEQAIFDGFAGVKADLSTLAGETPEEETDEEEEVAG